MEQQKQYKIEFYIGLLDSDELCFSTPIKEAVDKITELIGDCTIIPCIGSYKHQSGVRINMNSLKVIKFADFNTKQTILNQVCKFKEFFNQKCIITNIAECYNLHFN